tara:strand:+ start:204 stop:437 length:234 start_codon:yes stop_codon:yes gene_type:complete
LLKNGKLIKKSSPKAILDEVFAFADQHPQDPMALSASLMVVAKTIYLNMLGPEQTQDMIYAFAEGLEQHEYQKVTIH